MTRKAHPKKEIEEALRYAEENGWRVEESDGHPWGQIYCPYNDKDCNGGMYCRVSIWSTPRSEGNHAKQIERVIDRCSKHRK